jgi:hypothetical protein
VTAGFPFRDRREVSWFGALLLLAALPGCKGDGLSELQRAMKKEQDCANALRQQGGTVEEKKYPPFGEGYVVNLSGAQITDDTFKNLACLKRVAELNLGRSSITDAQMGQLNDVPCYLVRLDLSHTAVTDAGLDKMNHLYVLLYLNLAGTRITPEAVKRLQERRLASSLTRFKAPPKVEWK